MDPIVTSSEIASELGITNDLALGRITAAANEFVRNYCARDFTYAARTERVRGTGHPVIFLREEPVEAITEVRIDRFGAFGADTIVEDLGCFAVEGNRLIYINGYFPEAWRGHSTVQVTYAAGYRPAGNVAAALQEKPALPEQLREAVFLLVGERVSRGNGELMKSESMGSYSYTRFEGSLTPVVRGLLRKFKR